MRHSMKSSESPPYSSSDLARHAATSRLLASFVNERLIDAQYAPPLRCRFAALEIALAHHPVCIGNRIVHLHPEDVAHDSALPGPLELLAVTAPFLHAKELDLDSIAEIRNELASSFEHAEYAFAHAPPTPHINDAIAWEQSIVQGHATHPMHKARYSTSPLAPMSPNDSRELMSPGLRFAAVHSADLTTRGSYDDYIRRLVPADAWKDVAELERKHSTKLTVIPVHPLQIPNIIERFRNIAYILPARCTVSSRAQASIRTVLPSLPNLADAAPGTRAWMAVKTALGIKITSALRTVTPKTCHLGPGLHRIFAKLSTLVSDEELLIWPEEASAWPARADEDDAKHMSCIFRREFFYGGEHAIVIAALVEQDLRNVEFRTDRSPSPLSRAEVAFALRTLEERERFLSIFASALFRAFLPSVLRAGFAFESHPQNTLLRVRRSTEADDMYLGNGWALAGFAIRDFGGIKVHAATLLAGLNETLDVMADSCAIAESTDDVHRLAYHTLVLGILQSMVRTLGLHYSGRGWEIIRDALTAACPKDADLYRLWMRADWVDTKSFMRMKLEGLYRDYLYDPAPNLMMYRGEGWCATHSWPATCQIA